jgi:hypothetical protein
MKSSCRSTRQPVAGPLFKQAARLDVGGAKRRRLLCLLAAYADAGEHSPTVRQLAQQAKIPGGWRKVDQLLRLLERDGVVEVRWAKHGQARNVYELYLDGRRSP